MVFRLSLTQEMPYAIANPNIRQRIVVKQAIRIELKNAEK
ncbi:hypothetical protein FACS1894113_5130 [Alphaproteobacteria bacterium]|nr:hypothetical protein FACS1894113_5130 [Alphaproteobacteria bacterium]